MTSAESSVGESYIQLIRAPNRGPMTLDGTNTWVITDADQGALVVDPGPAIESHLEAVLAACRLRLVMIILTHRHLDHSEGAARLAERAGCGVRAADPQFRIGHERLDGGESWGSVVMAAGRLYVTSRKGVTTVFRPDPEKFELLAMNDLGEPSNATPAISDGQIFLRTDGHLYCIAEN